MEFVFSKATRISSTSLGNGGDAMKMREVDVICRMLTTKRNELKKLGHPQPEDAGIVRLALIAKIQVLEWVLGENRWEGI